MRFDPAGALDGAPAGALRDNGLAPTTVARVPRTATAVRWAAHGVGVTFVPASAVPPGHEHLVRPVSPALSPPVVAAARRGRRPSRRGTGRFGPGWSS
ncbi:LysR substrate-binding domain-containing protein [Streptomyces sp. NPDC003730]